MADQSAGRFNEKFSAYILPITLLILGYMAQQNYQEIRSQLNRIEQRQNADIVQIAEMKLRILNLEQNVTNQRDSGRLAPQIKPAPARFRPAYVYSQS